MLRPTRQIWKPNAFLWKKWIKDSIKLTRHLKCAAVFLLYSEIYLKKKQQQKPLKVKQTNVLFFAMKLKNPKSYLWAGKKKKKRKKEDQFDQKTITDDKIKYLMLVFWFIKLSELCNWHVFLEINPRGTGPMYCRYLNATEQNPWSTYFHHFFYFISSLMFNWLFFHKFILKKSLWSSL